MVTTIKCKSCSFCINIGRARAQGFKSYGRKNYYCNHKEACESNQKLTGDYSEFIGYGDSTFESPLQLKTAPKWCPRKREEK